MLIGTVQINSYAVVAIVMVLGVAWIAAMVFINTHEIITITVRSDILGHLGWYHKETNIAIGSSSSDEDGIVIVAGELEGHAPPHRWDKADEVFFAMVHARIIRRRPSNGERIVLVRRDSLPEKVQRYISDNRRILYSWI